MRSGLGPVLGRVGGIVAGLVVFGLFLRLLAGILQPVLPAALWQAIASGFDLLLSLVGPALPAIGAAVVLFGVVWVIVGRHR